MWHRSVFRPLALASSLLAALTITVGCDSVTSLIISNQQEVEIGKGVDEQLFHEYKIVQDDDPAAIWANELVASMVDASESFRKSSEFGGYKVQMIYDNNLVNAFAAPGGYVYIVSGLVLEADSCAEVAGVVGHELAHVTQRHSVKKLAKSAATLGLTSIILDEGLPKAVIDNVWNFLQNTTFSRKDESESDKVGTTIMYESGYNPYALAHMFQKFAEMSGGNEPPRFLSSHPLSADRQKAIRNQIEKSWPGEIDEVNDDTYTYDCMGTGYSFEEIQARLRDTSSIRIVAGSGTKPPAAQ